MGSPWRSSWEVTKPRSWPRAEMASIASSRRVVSFPFLHPLQSEHLGRGPVALKPKKQTGQNGPSQNGPSRVFEIHAGSPPQCDGPGLQDLARGPDVHSLWALRTFGDVELHLLVLF
jgi:hypothetical protein